MKLVLSSLLVEFINILLFFGLLNLIYKHTINSLINISIALFDCPSLTSPYYHPSQMLLIALLHYQYIVLLL